VARIRPTATARTLRLDPFWRSGLVRNQMVSATKATGGSGGMKAMTMAPSKNAPTTQGQNVRTFGRCEILVIGISPRVHELSIAQLFLSYGGPTRQKCHLALTYPMRRAISQLRLKSQSRRVNGVPCSGRPGSTHGGFPSASACQVSMACRPIGSAWWYFTPASTPAA